MDDYKPLSQSEIDRAYFFVSHRLLIKKIILIAFAVALAILYIILFFNLINFFRASSFEETARQIENSTFDWAAYHSDRAPQDIITASSQFISLGDRKYNLAVYAENPNDRWAAISVEYNFFSDGQLIASDISFLNPKERRLLPIIAKELDSPVRNLSVEIGDVEWQRIDNNFPSIEFDISNVAFQAASRQSTEDGDTIDLPSRVTWQAENLSLYNFWEVKWQVALFNSDRLVALQQVVSKDFLGLEKRNVEAVWLDVLPRVTRAEINMVLDKSDPSIYKDIYVAPSSDNR